MIEFEPLRGRLFGLRSIQPITMDDIRGLGVRIAELNARSTARWVFAVDLRRCGVMAPEVSSALVEVQKRDNPRAERSGLLLSGESATFALQVERVLRDSANPNRRAFRDPAALASWLAEVLTPDEAATLGPFLERGKQG